MLWTHVCMARFVRLSIFRTVAVLQILEWTKNVDDALEVSITLNDKWEMDGRDPNGYVGCMWSMCGVHDQVWPCAHAYLTTLFEIPSQQMQCTDRPIAVSAMLLCGKQRLKPRGTACSRRGRSWRLADRLRWLYSNSASAPCCYAESCIQICVI